MGGNYLGGRNLVALCANCHRIVTKFWKKWFEEWYNIYYEGFYKPSYNDLWKFGPDVLIRFLEEFYRWLCGNWESIESRLRKGMTSIRGLEAKSRGKAELYR